MAWDLNTVANVSTAVAVAAGLFFGVLQIRQTNRKRSDALALEALHFAQNAQYAQAVDVVLTLPEDMTSAELEAQPKDVKAAVSLVDYTIETLGWMVHRRMVPLHDLDDLMGGHVRATWKRLRRVAQERREQSGRANEFEWVQWLYERLEEDPSPGKAAGAHNSYARWRS